MSLFKVREFFNTQCGCNEEFDQFSIHVTNIDNASDNSDKIIVGSHSGILRIYGLKNTKLSCDQLDVDELAYQENEDVLVEMQFPFPILQVNSGILLSASTKRQLLILFPRKFGVYSVMGNEGLSEYGFSYSVTLLYEHELERTAFCATIGQFGQAKGRDFVCVQSLDCSLMFFEQETASFMRTMSNSLLPTSFTYVPTTDTFLIQSADWTLQCFRYQMLAISAQQDEKNSKNQRKIIPLDWTFELGEQVLQIESVCLDLNSSLIVVLGERNLFILRSNGMMFWQKKFDFKPIYCHSYFAYKGQALTDSDLIGSTTNGSSKITKHTAGQDQKQSLLERDLVTLLITEMCTMNVYNDKQLKWACKLPQSYCQVQRANFYFTPNCQLIGCLTFLSSVGHLALAFLGTNPSLNIVNNVQSNLMNRRSSNHKSSKQNKSITKSNKLSDEDKEQLFTDKQMDKEEFDKELNELRKIINAYNSDFSSLIKLNTSNDGQDTKSQTNDLKVELINFKFDTLNDNFSKQIKVDKLQSNNVIDLEFSLETNKQLTNLIINLNTSSCFNITPNLHNLIKLEATKDNNFQFRLFYDSFNKLISFGSNQIYLVINYLNDKNLPRIFTRLIQLPMNFFCKLQNQSMFNRTDSSTNTSHNSSASHRSLRQGILDKSTDKSSDKLTDKLTDQSMDKTLEQSLDQYLLEDNSIRKTNAISFQILTKKTSINLTNLLQDMINQNNVNKSIKNIEEDNLKSNKLTVQFINSKLKLVLVELLNSMDDKDKFENELNDKLVTYRMIIIGDDLHSNCIVSNLLITALHQFYLDRTFDRIVFSKSSIPIKEYLELINLHLNLRQTISNKKKQLEEHCERLRVIEKRILIKLKDRNISNLNNLENLLNVQHQKIMSLVNEILLLQQQFEDESIKLNCCNQLVCLILKCVLNMNEEENQLLEGSFNILPFVQTNDLEQWQERTELSLNFLLRNHLKDNLNISKASTIELVQSDDCNNLFKLIKTVIDKTFIGNLFAPRFGNISKTNLDKHTILEENEEI